MPWARFGDNAATYPALLAVASTAGADDRLVNEAAGFVFRCAIQSAGHMTDYVVNLGTAQMLAPTRWKELIDAAVQVGLLVPKGRGARRVWHLVEDAEFIHIRAREEVHFERARKRDNSNAALTTAVRLRDGDGCRWCGNVVIWTDRVSGRGGTYDHLEPGKPATVETLVVACKSCNSSRKTGEHWSADLLPAPMTPYYGPKTLEQLAKNGTTVPVAPSPSAVPQPAGKRASGGPATSGRTPTPAVPSEGVRDDSAEDNPHLDGRSRPATVAAPPLTSGNDPAVSADPGRNRGYGPGRVGSGRVGSGSPPGLGGASRRPSNRRSRRGRGGGGSRGST